MSDFFDRFFTLEMREQKVPKSINLLQRSQKMSKFVLDVSEIVVSNCCTSIIINDMDISCMIVCC